MQRLMICLVAIAFAGVLVGCKKNVSASADLKYSVFEVSRDLAEELVEIHEANEMFNLAQVSHDVVDKLLNNMSESPGLLAEDTRKVSFWPGIADTWAYSRADQNLLGNGGGSGFLGVRIQDSHREVRIEYDVSHSINTLEPVQAKIFYDGAMPKNRAVVALIPFHRKNDSEQVLVIAFTAENWMTD